MHRAPPRWPAAPHGGHWAVDAPPHREGSGRSPMHRNEQPGSATALTLAAARAQVRSGFTYTVPDTGYTDSAPRIAPSAQCFCRCRSRSCARARAPPTCPNAERQTLSSRALPDGLEISPTTGQGGCLYPRLLIRMLPTSAASADPCPPADSPLRFARTRSGREGSV